MRKFTLILVVGFLSLVLSSNAAIAAKKYLEVDAKQTKELMETKDALVVFPLSPVEFDHKHIKGSVNITMSMLKYDLPKDKNKDIVFYCLGVKCVASWRAAEKAADLGYKNVYAFRDGLPGWEKEGYPVVTVKPLPDVKVENISTADLASLLVNDDVVLLDINLEDDAKKFYIDNPKRTHIPLDELNVSLSQLPKNKKICVVCLKGKRSPTAVKYLVGQGYEDVVMVAGGVQKWVLEGRPVKKAN